MNKPKIFMTKKRKNHSLDLPKLAVDTDVLDALHAFGTPVTTTEYVTGDETSEELWYHISVLAADDEWDSINRKLGKLGIDR